MIAAASPPDGDAEGRVICQKYRLESLLGEGGMGAVWRAFNLQLEVPVAIKLLRAGLDSPELGERLRVEARAAAKLVHPSIVRVFDIGDAESGEPFIVMELLSGESLGQMLERGPLPAVNALQLLLPIAEALSLAHSRGVVHRDLKPDNIFLATEGDSLQPKLLDFGIAKVTSGSAAGGATLTQSGTLLGSPEYMSPEQAMGSSDVDARSDVWSFCVLLYETVSGTVPFTGESCQSILRSVLGDEPMPLELLVPVDPRLSEIILRGLAKNRDARPASIFDLGQELAAWLYERGTSEDATGASLEAKWLGRSSDNLLLTHPHTVHTPRAQHDHATLVSVVHPRPRAQTEPLEIPMQRRRRWVPAMLVAVAAFFAAGWASLSHMQPNLAAAWRTPAPAQVAGAAVAAPVAAVSPMLPAQTSPSQPIAPRSQPSAAPVKPELTQARTHVPSGSVNLTPAAVRVPFGKPAVPPGQSLPQALPSRDPGQELLDPY